MISFNIQSLIGKYRYQVYMDRQMRVFEKYINRKLYSYFYKLYDRVADLISEGDLRIEQVIFNNLKLYGLLLGFYHKVFNFYFSLFLDSVEKVKEEDRTKDLEKDFWEEYRRETSNHVAQRVNGISESARKKMQKTIEKGLEEKLTNAQISRNLLKTKEIDSAVRARRIAATETHTISTKTMNDMAIREEVINEKEWIAANDERTRVNHLTSRGFFSGTIHPTTVPINSPFIVGGERLEYPGDPFGSAGNIIYCRCTTLYHTKKKVG